MPHEAVRHVFLFGKGLHRDFPRRDRDRPAQKREHRLFRAGIPQRRDEISALPGVEEGPAHRLRQAQPPGRPENSLVEVPAVGLLPVQELFQVGPIGRLPGNPADPAPKDGNVKNQTGNKGVVQMLPEIRPLVVDEAGKVYVASASIVNNSTGDVMVSSVSVTSKNGWEFVPYSTNMAKAKVDAKQVGFKINSSETSKTGDSEVFTLAAPWTVKEADALSINYDAVVSAVSQPVTGQEIMSVVFVLEWA